jgi:thiosulfate reductase cytochrome b subunit
MVSVKKVAAWLLIAFVLFYVLSAPESSAGIVRSAIDGLEDAAGSLSRFLQSLF